MAGGFNEELINLMVKLDSVVAQSPDQVSAEVDNEVVMMSVEKGLYYGLDEVASHIWRALAEPQTPRALCAALVQEFDVESDECEKDVLELLEELAKQDLIVIK